MKTLIFGAGYLGSRLIDGLSGIHEVATADSRDPYVGEWPDVVINAVGRTGSPNIDWCESNKHGTYKANVIFALNLAAACTRAGPNGVYMIHLSSGCCFYGPRNGCDDSDGGWREDDDANPESFYSRTKYAADLVLSKLPNVAVVRLRMPIDYTPHPKNLITKLASYSRVIDVCNSVTVLDDLVAVIAGLVEKRGTGIFHAVNPGGLWHRELLDLYAGYVDPNHRVEYIAPADLPTKAPRSTAILANTRLPDLGLTMRPIHEALPEVMKRYAEIVHAGAQAT